MIMDMVPRFDHSLRHIGFGGSTASLTDFAAIRHTTFGEF